MSLQQNSLDQEMVKDLISFYHSLLMKNELPLSYLRLRGINRESIIRFQLGYTYGSKGWDRTKKESKFFLKKRFNHIDLFVNRIIFPITYRGEIVSATSRTIIDLEPKHLHLPGSIEHFFNQDRLHNTEYIFIVESPIDAIILEQNGINAVATLGIGGITAKNTHLLKDKQIFICFDTDENQSGIRGAVRFAKILAKQKIKSRIVVLPNNGGKNDIATFFKSYGVEDFRHVVSKSINYKDVNLDVKVTKQTTINPKGQSKMLCPYHKDNKPSLVIYYDTQSYYCFGCGAHGPIKNLEQA